MSYSYPYLNLIPVFLKANLTDDQSRALDRLMRDHEVDRAQRIEKLLSKLVEEQAITDDSNSETTARTCSTNNVRNQSCYLFSCSLHC